MKTIIEKNENEVAEAAAAVIAGEISGKERCVLGLPTGQTPLMTYLKLIGLYETGQADFSRVTTFNLDEYVGLSPEDTNSYHHFMHANFFDRINLDEENINLLNGVSPDFSREARDYDEKIARSGGIDLQLLGIGNNGHIGFNEPGSELAIETHITELTEETLKQNGPNFGDPAKMPRKAITMGFGAIMAAGKILLLATGARKAEAMAQFLTRKEIRTNVPASLLHLHPDCTVIMDEDAASAL